MPVISVVVMSVGSWITSPISARREMRALMIPLLGGCCCLDRPSSIVWTHEAQDIPGGGQGEGREGGGWVDRWMLRLLLLLGYTHLNDDDDDDDLFLFMW